MDFGVIPPEINSARMYTGPGPGSLMAASQAWTELAAELHIAAESCRSTVSALTEGAWLGPSSLAMAAAAAPYVVWLTATATRTERTAGQANAAASAYESALALTVPPALVAANRSTVAMLIASNVLGQNAPAIAATEAAYYEMWAQDATAMYGYASSSAAAAAVEPFASPPPTTGQAERAATAVAKSSASAAASTAESTAPQLLSAVPAALQDLASPTVPGSTTETLSLVTGLNLLSYPGRFATFPLNFLSKALGFAKSATAPAAAAATGAAAAALGRAAPLELSNVAPAISASLGQARIAGPMSVPHSWSGLAPLASNPAAIPPVAGPALAAALPTGISAGTPVMPVVANSGRNAMVSTPRYDLRPTVIPRCPAAG